MEYQSRSFRVDDEVYEAVQSLSESLNQYLRRVLLEKPTKKISKKAAHVEALKASDPMASERPEIDYGSEELPSGGSVSVVGAAPAAWRKPSGKSDAYQDRYCGPLLKPGAKK